MWMLFCCKSGGVRVSVAMKKDGKAANRENCVVCVPQVRVVLAYTRTFSTYTRGCFEWTHGEGRESSSVLRTKICPQGVNTCFRGNPWILPIFKFLRFGLEQHVPDSSNHSLYLIKLAIQIFWSQRSPRPALTARDVARDLRHGRQRVAPFYHDPGLNLVGLIGHCNQEMPASEKNNSLIQIENTLRTLYFRICFAQLE